MVKKCGEAGSLQIQPRAEKAEGPGLARWAVSQGSLLQSLPRGLALWDGLGCLLPGNPRVSVWKHTERVVPVGGVGGRKVGCPTVRRPDPSLCSTGGSL